MTMHSQFPTRGRRRRSRSSLDGTAILEWLGAEFGRGGGIKTGLPPDVQPPTRLAEKCSRMAEEQEGRTALHYAFREAHAHAQNERQTP